MIDNFGVERNPIKLLHPTIKSDINITLSKNAIRKYDEINSHIGVMKTLSKEELEKIPEHKWLKKCETMLYGNSSDDFTSEEELLEILYNELLSNSRTISDEVCLKQEKKVIAVDLETTGLNKTIMRVGGNNIIHNKIVGVCLSVDTNKGYYIPVRHNEKDNVRNFTEKSIISFMQKILDNFHCVYHNAVFDMEVLSQSGVYIKNSHSFSDTMILSILSGYKQEYRQVGLKFLSETLLERSMLEISKITGNKSEIRLWTIPAKNAYVYGCSDAMNTLALFYYILDDENPYKKQKNTTILDHKTINVVRYTYRHGLPINYKRTLDAFRTSLRRLIILENTFEEIISDKDVSISSSEQVGTHIYKLLKKEFERQMVDGKREINHKEKAFDLLVKNIKKSFGMEVKIKELKNNVTKIVANSSDDVLTNLYNNLETWDWVSEDVADEIYYICEIIGYYRSLYHEAAIFLKMIKYCYNDDLNICRGGIGLKLLGADTSRFSNQSSKRGGKDSVEIWSSNKGMQSEYSAGDGIIGINSQGISNKKGSKAKVKRILNLKEIDEDIYNKKVKLDNITEAYLKEVIETGSL